MPLAADVRIVVWRGAELGEPPKSFDDIPLPDNSANNIDNGDNSGSQQQPLTENGRGSEETKSEEKN